MCESMQKRQYVKNFSNINNHEKNDIVISCLPVSLYPLIRKGEMDIIKWSEIAYDMGLDMIDINMFFLKGFSLADAASIKKRLRLPVLMVCTYSDFTNPNKKCRAEAIVQAQNEIRLASQLGARYFRLTAGQNYPGLTDQEAVDGIAECFSACVSIAEENGLRLLIENHSRPGAWQYDDFNFHSERFLRLWGALKTLPIGVNFDTANAFALDCWEELMQAVAGRVETVHMNDLSTISPMRFCCVGEGIVPNGRILGAISRTGFRGPVCIEEAGMCGVEGMTRAIASVKALCMQNFFK